MSFLKKTLYGEYSLGFTFWVMGCVAPVPLFVAKYVLRETGVFTHDDTAVFLAGRAFLWLEWLFFAFITVALWNASVQHLKRVAQGQSGSVFWGQFGRVLSVASGMLALGSFSNLSGITTLVFGRPLFLALGAG